MTDQQRSDELNWKIAGIRSERLRVEERLRYLNDQEKTLSEGGIIGKGATASKATAKPKAKGTRKRTLSEETKQKMRDAALRRHAAKGNTATEPVPPPVDTQIPGSV